MKTGINFHKLGRGSSFLQIHQKEKLEFIKINKCAPKDSIKKVKINYKLGENMSKANHLSLKGTCIPNIQKKKPTKNDNKKTTQMKNGQRI